MKNDNKYIEINKRTQQNFYMLLSVLLLNAFTFFVIPSFYAKLLFIEGSLGILCFAIDLLSVTKVENYSIIKENKNHTALDTAIILTIVSIGTFFIYYL